MISRNAAKPSISVIIPVYNIDPYLKKCIDSVLNQHFADFELLLVDDGSTDNSGEICDIYAQKDSRVRVFHQRNAGVSTVRNNGLENAIGKYIAFVDSDDYVLPDYLRDLYNSLSDDNCLVIHTVIKHFPDGNSVRFDWPETTIEGKEAYRLLTEYGDKNIGYSCGKLFNNELIRSHHLRFHKDISLLEDLFFLFDYAQISSSIKVCNVANYVYRIGYSNAALSVTYKSLSEECLIFQTYYQYIEKFVQSSGFRSADFEDTWRSLRILFHRILLVLYSRRADKSYKERMACLKELRCKYAWWILGYFKPDYLADKVTAYFLRRELYMGVDLWMRLLLAVYFRKMFGGKRY